MNRPRLAAAACVLALCALALAPRPAAANPQRAAELAAEQRRVAESLSANAEKIAELRAQLEAAKSAELDGLRRDRVRERDLRIADLRIMACLCFTITVLCLVVMGLLLPPCLRSLASKAPARSRRASEPATLTAAARRA